MSELSPAAPFRVRRRRTRGWRMSENTVYVGRPTRWGNPHTGGTHTSMVERYSESLHSGQLGFTVAEVRRELAGRNLACWCGDSQPCHADVLLAVANPHVT